MAIEAVVFDVGETLVNETTEYHAWADWLGVPRHTFSGAMGHIIASGRDYREVFQFFRPGFDLDNERVLRAEAGKPETFGEEDLYDDARFCLQSLRDSVSLVVGIAGNQTARARDILRGLELPTDFVWTSDDWEVSKPDARFFNFVVQAVNHERPYEIKPEEILYVGDRADNDLQPAWQQGLRTAHIARGLWGMQLPVPPVQPDGLHTFNLQSLVHLSEFVADFNQRRR